MLPLAFGFGGPWDIAILGGVLILLFGGSKLAGFGKSLGQGITEFKKATTDDEKTPVAPVVVQTPPVVVGSPTEDKSVR
jgi:sec-independent protein translocase protein TatA